MIDALGLAGTRVLSASRVGGKSHIVEHGPRAAKKLFSTPDRIRALSVSPSGAIHAFGKRYHTNRAGDWNSRPTIKTAEFYSCWAASDDDVFAGGPDGAYALVGGACVPIDGIAFTVFGVHGTSPHDVYFAGELPSLLAHYDGKHARVIALPEDAYLVQSVLCMSRDDVWLCGIHGAYRGNARTGFKSIAKYAGDSGELYGVGLGKRGVFAHAGSEILRLDGKRWVVDRETIVRNAEFGTAIASNGMRVVAADLDSVLVDDGRGFTRFKGL